MATFSSYNSLGSSIEETELTDGAVTGVKLAGDLIFKEIETITLTSSNVTLADFSSIASGYKTFLLIGEYKNASGQNCYMTFNNDSSNIYETQEHRLSNTTIAGVLSNTQPRINININDDASGTSFYVLINNSSTKYKRFFIQAGGQQSQDTTSGTYDTNTEINRITIISSSTMTDGKVTLYGAK